MNRFSIALTFGVATCLIQPTAAVAQASKDESATVRAEKRAQGAEVARNFKSGEGDPVPESKAKASRDERAKARQARSADGAAAAKSFRSGEGDPKPAAVAKQSSDKRHAERVAKRDEVKAANKAGEIPNYGENSSIQK